MAPPSSKLPIRRARSRWWWAAELGAQIVHSVAAHRETHYDLRTPMNMLGGVRLWIAKVPAAATGTHSVCGDQTSADRLPRPALGNPDRAARSPGRLERAARCDPEQVVPEGEQPFGAKCRFPWPEPVSDSGLSGARVQARPFSVSTICRARVPRVWASLHVALGTEFVHELRRGLPGHVQV